MGPFKHLLCVRLENQPLARPEAVDVDHAVIFLRQFFQKIVLVALRLSIDVPLRALQRVEVAFHVRQLGVFVQQEADHERGAETLAKALLLR